jgi:hypothetical protein
MAPLVFMWVSFDGTAATTVTVTTTASGSSDRDLMTTDTIGSDRFKDTITPMH